MPLTLRWLAIVLAFAASLADGACAQAQPISAAQLTLFTHVDGSRNSPCADFGSAPLRADHESGLASLP